MALSVKFRPKQLLEDHSGDVGSYWLLWPMVSRDPNMELLPFTSAGHKALLEHVLSF